MLKELILSFLVQHIPPGGSWHSVEPMPSCGNLESPSLCELAPLPVCDEPTMLCRPPRWSGTHNAWVRSESEATGLRRYELAARILDETARFVLCIDDDGEQTKGCKPLKWGYSFKRKRNLGTLKELIGSAVGSAIPESGFREDVQTGRGKSGKPVDEGEGRGKGGEVCFAQIIPSMVWRFADWLTDDEREAARSSKEARERIALTLVGAIDDPEPLRRCFYIQLRMLAHSRNFCDARSAAWYEKSNLPIKRQDTYWWAMGMYSYYGVGPLGAGGGCYDYNQGKTLLRVRTLQRLLAKAEA